MPARDQDAEPVEGAGCGSERRRSGKRQRAGAAHHQHRNHHPQGALRIDPPPRACRGTRRHDQDRDEPLCDAIRDLRDVRLVGLRPVHEADDAGEHGLRPDLRHAHSQRALQIDTPADYRVTGALRDRARLAGQQGLVSRTLAGRHHAVRGNDAAGRNSHEITRHKLNRGDPLRGHRGGAGDEAFGHRRRVSHQTLLGFGGPRARHRLEIPGAKQQKHEHGDRVEIDFAAAAHRRPHARREGDGDAQRHGHVHPRTPRVKITPRAREERRRRPQDYGNRQRQARPAHELFDFHRQVPIGEVGGQCVHHDLHHGEARHEQSPQHDATLAQRRGFAGHGIESLRAIAEVRNRPQYRAQADPFVVPFDLGAARCEIHRNAQHAVEAPQPALDQPRASSASDTFDEQRCVPDAARGDAHERFLHGGNVVRGKRLRQR